MTCWITYPSVLALLVVAELFYFRVAARLNIIDKPNLRSSHTRITLRGGGIRGCTPRSSGCTTRGSWRG